MDPDSYTKRMTVEYDGELLLEIEGTRRLRAKPDKKFVDGQAAIPSW